MVEEDKRVVLSEWLSCPAIKKAFADIPLKERLRHFPPFGRVGFALRRVLALENHVNDAAEKTGVMKSGIRSVLFREILGYGLEDLFDRFRKNASRGVAQIRPSTAMKADRALGFPEEDLKVYRKMLMNPASNILYCARILKAEALRIGADPAGMKGEELVKVFTAYNGSERYGRKVAEYCRCMEKETAR